ncbi:MAG: trans-sulfuration enzyme family protein [Pseudomonadota bacterium]
MDDAAPTTLACHAGRDDLARIGVHAPPLDLSSTYPIHGLPTAEAAFAAFGRGEDVEGEPIYGRLHNQTVARFEHALAALEGTESAVAFASGMAAMTACLLAAREDGTRVVAIRPLYGGTDGLLSSGLLGLDVVWAEPETVGEAVGPGTALVLFETPQNPTLGLVDIGAVVAASAPVPVLVDNTFATPVLQNPAAHGATLVLHSATKYLGGHGDAVGGVVATTETWARRLRRVRILTGGLLHPLGAYLLHRGLPTLPFRVEAAQERAAALAERLAAHPRVAGVHYPGAPGGDPAHLLGRQLRGPGAMLAFEVEGGHDAAAALLRSVRLITPAVSLGTTDTLIEHPAGLTHALVDAEARRAAGVTPGLLRLSVGLEDVEDLWADLACALDASRRARPRTRVLRRPRPRWTTRAHR